MCVKGTAVLTISDDDAASTRIQMRILEELAA